MDKKIVWESNLGFNPVFVNQIIRVDNNGFCEYEFSGSQGSLFAIPSEAKEIADAIYTELGLGWLPYPENVPETDKYYLVTIDDVFNGLYVDAAQYIPAEDAWYSWDGIIKKEDGNEVVAYRELSAPYQP